MAERKYLAGAIQKEGGRLADESARFIRIGCGIPFDLPTGRQRISVVENLRLKIGTEKNGGLVGGVVIGKYHWAIAGEDMVEELSDHERDKVTIVRRLGFQPCQYRLGIWEGSPEKLVVVEGRTSLGKLEDLRPNTMIATKHVNYLGRVIRERGLNLKAVYDRSPETAPELRGIVVVADNYETGGTWRELKPYGISPREVFLESQAVLIKAKRLPWGRARMFNEILLPRVDQALEHPERWLNPDALSSVESIQMVPSPRMRIAREVWDRVRAFSGQPATATVAS